MKSHSTQLLLSRFVLLMSLYLTEVVCQLPQAIKLYEHFLLNILRQIHTLLPRLSAVLFSKKFKHENQVQNMRLDAIDHLEGKWVCAWLKNLNSELRNYNLRSTDSVIVK